MPPVARVLADSVAEALRLVEEAAATVESGTGDKAELAVIVSNLVTIWGLVERDPGVQAAALDVFESAATLIHGEEPASEPRLRRLLRDAVKRLRARVGSARPNAAAVCSPELRDACSEAEAA